MIAQRSAPVIPTVRSLDRFLYDLSSYEHGGMLEIGHESAALKFNVPFHSSPRHCDRRCGIKNNFYLFALKITNLFPYRTSRLKNFLTMNVTVCVCVFHVKTARSLNVLRRKEFSNLRNEERILIFSKMDRERLKDWILQYWKLSSWNVVEEKKKRKKKMEFHFLSAKYFKLQMSQKPKGKFHLWR